MQTEQTTQLNSGNPGIPSSRTISAFTFYLSDNLYALESANVLSVKDDSDNIQNLPVKGQGILGVYKYLETVVPVFDYARLIGVDSGQQVMQTLIENLEAREKDHIEWLDALEKSITDDVLFTKAMDPHQCAFGKWYDQFETRDETLREILVKFDAPHNRIHSLAEKLLSLRDQKKQDEALEILKVERHTTLRRLRSLFSQAREQVQGAMRPVIIFVTKDGVVPIFGILIDEINDVVEYNGSDKQSDIVFGQQNDETADLFSGMYVKDEGPDSIICNIDNILKH